VLRVVEGEPSTIGDWDPASIARVPQQVTPDDERGALTRLLGRVTIRHIIAAMLLYVAGAMVLALVYDRSFLFNDALALIVFAVLIGGLVVVERRVPSS
jgi:hypothetical protein